MLDPDLAALVAVLAVAVALVALTLVVALLSRVRRLQGALDELTGSGVPFAAAVERQRAAADALRRDLDATRTDLTAVRADLSGALRHVAVVRYDAFDDMGGRLSFSAALLDDAGDGFVLTSINARAETRTYAKGVKGAFSEHALSPEEEQAICYAQRTAVPPGEDAAPKARRRLSRT